ncbi:hypothetical protein D3C81_1204500 [compost metagenome]
MLGQYAVCTHAYRTLHRLIELLWATERLNPPFAHDKVLRTALLNQLRVLTNRMLNQRAKGIRNGLVMLRRGVGPIPDQGRHVFRHRAHMVINADVTLGCHVYQTGKIPWKRVRLNGLALNNACVTERRFAPWQPFVYQRHCAATALQMQRRADADNTGSQYHHLFFAHAASESSTLLRDDTDLYQCIDHKAGADGRAHWQVGREE